MRFPEWTGFEGKKFWEWLDLLLVPLILAIGVGAIETTESRRQRYSLDEQYKQQLLRDYFSELNVLVFDEKKYSALRDSSRHDRRRELLGSRTLATLDILGEDSNRKIQIIRFVGNSSLSEVIPIRRADLSGLDLSHVALVKADLRKTTLKGTNLTGVDLSGADLSGADLSGTDLSGAYLCGAYLSQVNFEGAILTDAHYSETTIFSESPTISEIQLNSMEKEPVDSCSPSQGSN